MTEQTQMDGMFYGGSRDEQRALVVDDDQALRKLVKILLEREGFSVTEAAHGREALELIAGEDQRFDLIVSDLNMPHMGGLDLVREAHKAIPELPVLLVSSDFSEDAESFIAENEARIRRLEKPYLPDEFIEAVKNTINLQGKRREAGGFVAETATNNSAIMF